MSYSFYGFIGTKAPLDALARRFSKARMVELPQDIFVIPLVDELRSEMCETTNAETIDGFEYLTKQIEAAITQVSRNGTVAYAEVLIWGGEGDQQGIIWENGERVRTVSNNQVINSILKHFGVVARKGRDEFLTMGFGLRRDTDDWIEI